MDSDNFTCHICGRSVSLIDISSHILIHEDSSKSDEALARVLQAEEDKKDRSKFIKEESLTSSFITKSDEVVAMELQAQYEREVALEVARLNDSSNSGHKRRSNDKEERDDGSKKAMHFHHNNSQQLEEWASLGIDPDYINMDSIPMEAEEKEKFMKKFNWPKTFKEQYLRNLKYAATKHWINETEAKAYEERLENLELLPDTESSTPEFTWYLQETYKRKAWANSVSCVYLCLPVDHFSSSYGDRGWGCGWRNTQMMASSLLHSKNPRVRAALFSGQGYVPSILGIQKLFEKLWADGYDMQGAQQLGGSIYNTRKWIGATDTAALLGYFGIRTKIFDFPFKGSRALASKSILFDWIWSYFSSGRPAKEMSPPSKVSQAVRIWDGKKGGNNKKKGGKASKNDLTPISPITQWFKKVDNDGAAATTNTTTTTTTNTTTTTTTTNTNPIDVIDLAHDDDDEVFQGLDFDLTLDLNDTVDKNCDDDFIRPSKSEKKAVKKSSKQKAKQQYSEKQNQATTSTTQHPLADRTADDERQYLTGWAKEATTDRISETPVRLVERYPIMMNWHGHSILIVGIEQMKATKKQSNGPMKRNLLILEPGSSTANYRERVKRDGPRVCRKYLGSFKKDRYQLLTIDVDKPLLETPTEKYSAKYITLTEVNHNTTKIYE